VTNQDIFPVNVVFAAPDFPVAVGDMRSMPPTPDAAYVQTARVIITGDRIVVARDSNDGPQIVFQDRIDPTTHYKSPRPSEEDSYVTTVTGKKLAFRKDSACGCGSRLKSWNPNKHLTSNQDPTQ
jgi:hypothetical protein